MLSNTSMQQKLLRLFSAFPCSYWLPLLQHRGCCIRILTHGQLLKDLGLFHDCLFNKLSSISCSQLYFILMWSPFYSLKCSFNIILLYLTSFSNPSTMLIYYIMLQENTIIMGGHGQRDESNFPSNGPAKLKISGEKSWNWIPGGANVQSWTVEQWIPSCLCCLEKTLLSSKMCFSGSKALAAAITNCNKQAKRWGLEWWQGWMWAFRGL